MTPESYSKLSDEQLAKAAQDNVDAFELIVERYEQPLLRYILRISHFSAAEAEEILQEVFVKAWKKLNDFDVDLKFSSWIYRITHNQTISEFRKAKARGLQQDVKWDEDLLAGLPDKIDLPRELDQKIESAKVRKWLNALPDKYRTILILRFLEEKSYDEISDILKIPMGTAATLVSRAKKAFQEMVRRSDMPVNS